jgi:SAM-dependent methyltransferase
MPSNEASVRDVAYTHGYYRALSPTMISAALERQGLVPPDVSAPLNYCELGMGFGVSLLASAACFPHMRFYGNDFNPLHIDYAQRLADDAGLRNVELFEDGFEELLQRDLPQMDVIAMHGVYSWVSPALRQVIAQFIDRRLKPGGVVYVSHNTLPGWSSLMPLRQLIHRHAMRGGARRAPADQLRDAVAGMQAMESAGAAYFDACPAASERLAKLALDDPNYVAHEYFNPHWQPQYVHEVAEELAAAGLVRGAAALIEDHVDAAWLTAPARAQLEAETDPLWRETWRDVHLNQSFRRDLYTRGAERLSSSAHEARLLDRRWALAVARAEIPGQPFTGQAAALFDESAVTLLLDALRDGPVSVRSLLRHPAIERMGAARVLDGLMLLSGTADVHPALPEPLALAARDSVQRFNAVAMARGGGDGLLPLACATTGQAVGFSAPALAQLRAYRAGARDAQSLAQAMEPSADGAGEALLASAQRFMARRVPLIEQLGL